MALNLNSLNTEEAENTMQESLEAQAIIAGLEEVESGQVVDGPSALQKIKTADCKINLNIFHK